MKTTKLLSSIIATGALTLGANAAFAQSEAWQGLFAQAGVGGAVFTPSFSGGLYGGAYPYSASKNDINTMVGAVAVGYTFALSGPWTLGIGAGMLPGTSSAASYSVAVTTPFGTSTSAGRYSVSNTYTITLQPGYAIDKEKLVYLKAGYTGATANTSSDSFGDAHSTLSGYVLGIGYKQIITGGLFGYAEFNYAKYGNINVPYSTLSGTLNASAIEGQIGLGWRF